MQPLVITKEHEWLNRFLGDWSYDQMCPTGVGDEMFRLAGTEHVRSIGGVWIHGEGRATMPDGSPMTTINIVGYDTAKKQYVGAWTGSMMTHMFVYHGWVEPDGRTLVLESTGPCMMDASKQRKYRDITEFVSDDHRAFRSEMLGDDGKWSKMMSMDMHRIRAKG